MFLCLLEDEDEGGNEDKDEDDLSHLPHNTIRFILRSYI